MIETHNASKTSVEMPKKFVYFFAAGETDGNAGMKAVLGGKGANLAEMTSLGLPVPPGFTISTEICRVFNANGQTLADVIKKEVTAALGRIEKLLGKKFGDIQNPLLVSVRSGARASMPGMMDTILNLGLNDQTVEGLAKQSKNPRFAWDSYRRFVQMYSDVVMGMNSSFLEVSLEDMKDAKGYKNDTDLSASDLKELVTLFKKQIQDSTGQTFPTDPWLQLWGAISAVFRSWNTARAITYRELNNIPNDWGTAVNVQSMVFGNMGDESATGVAFTRNPSTGAKELFGEFLVNAQGEDVVAGIRTPLPITKKEAQAKKVESLEELMPDAYKQLTQIFQKLETHYKDMQDIEFTIENKKLWMLQTRNGKRTAKSALRIACELVDEKLITDHEALLRVDPHSLDQLLHPMLDPKAPKTVLAKGLPASPGGAVGTIVFSSEDAVAASSQGKPVILVRLETSPEDIQGMAISQGILTSRGGMTSHAAVVARGMGKCCVAGCADVEIDASKKEMRVKGYLLKEGDALTLDGSSGEVILGSIPMVKPELDSYFQRLMTLADKVRKLGVRANADTPEDAKIARGFGAEGIGLCRTEHMFFGPDRIDVMRSMILADETEERKKALDRLLPMQREDFIGIFEAMEGLPVTIRFLDPPLHEFLPHTVDEMEEMAPRLKTSVERLRMKVSNLHEFNPMLGHRGCRLAVTFPEIYQMQARAIAEAAIAVKKKGIKVFPEIMIPIVAVEAELKKMRVLVEEEVMRVQKKEGQTFEYLVGTMIELPRAALTADQIAQHADFFSFGTNDLTQTALGISRDDAGRFLATYIAEGLYPKDPFVTIDRGGVGELVRMACQKGQSVKPKLKLGICGEHGGDPSSIEFFNEVGLNYVSCSPFRVPIARLAAAQAHIQQAKKQ